LIDEVEHHKPNNYQKNQRTHWHDMRDYNRQHREPSNQALSSEPNGTTCTITNVNTDNLRTKPFQAKQVEQVLMNSAHERLPTNSAQSLTMRQRTVNGPDR
jgi:hypothetical protein